MKRSMPIIETRRSMIEASYKIGLARALALGALSA
jgi:hypothetical protein